MLIKDTTNSRQSGEVLEDIFIVSGTASAIVKEREFFSLIVDEPCLKACEYLYDCNILTTGSSANGTNFVDHGEITVKYSSLSDENKQIYMQLVEQGLAKPVHGYDKETETFKADVLVSDAFHLLIPMNDTTTVEEFSEEMLALAKHFKPQDVLYGNYTPYQMFEFMLKLIENNGRTVYVTYQSILDYMYSQVESGNIKVYEDGSWDLEQTVAIFDDAVCHYYHDKNEDKYWIHESLYKRHIDFVGKHIN